MKDRRHLRLTATRALLPVAIWAVIVCAAYLAQWNWNDAWTMQRVLGAQSVRWPLVCGGLAIALVVSWVSFAIHARSAARARIVEHGASTTARVIELRQIGSGEDTSYAYVEAVVEFEVSAGPRLQSSARFNLAYIHAPRYQPGCTIRIQYDPAEPTSIAIEDAM